MRWPSSTLPLPRAGLIALAAFLLAGLALALVLGQLGYRLRAVTPATAASAVDIGFAQTMSRHHQQAIGLARQLLDGRPTGLAPLAQRMLETQLVELGEMRGWLRLWGASLHPPASGAMDWMLRGQRPPDAALRQYLLDCARAPGGMVGLATAEDLLALDRLEGRARDARFLELMLAHHEGGLPMARLAAREAALPVVRRLAAEVLREQSEEIRTMRLTLNVLAAKAEP